MFVLFYFRLYEIIFVALVYSECLVHLQKLRLSQNDADILKKQFSKGCLFNNMCRMANLWKKLKPKIFMM